MTGDQSAVLNSSMLVAIALMNKRMEHLDRWFMDYQCIVGTRNYSIRAVASECARSSERFGVGSKASQTCPLVLHSFQLGQPTSV